MADVEYRMHPTYSDHRIGDDGSVCKWNGNAWIPRKQSLVRKPSYWSIWLDGNQVCVHILVLETFVGPRPAGMLARHLDDNRDNNSKRNLTWGTHEENMADARKHRCHARGERQRNAKLTAADVIAIRRRNAAGESARELGRQYGVTGQNITKIVLRKSWQHIA